MNNLIEMARALSSLIGENDLAFFIRGLGRDKSLPRGHVVDLTRVDAGNVLLPPNPTSSTADASTDSPEPSSQ